MCSLLSPSRTLPDIIIYLDRLTYSPGELVTGNVNFHLEKPYDARFLKISWKGEAKTSIGRFVKNYLNNYMMVWQSTNGDHRMPAGTHNYPFSFRLPSDCPPSFAQFYGKIRYCVQAEFDRPGKRNQTFTQYFIVEMTARKTPIEKTFTKACMYKNYRSSGAIFSDGVFSMNVRLDKRFFAPGETLRALVEIQNNTSKPIVNLRCELISQSHYHSRPQEYQCTISDTRYCPLAWKHRQEDEHVIQMGDYPLNVKPYQSISVKVEVELNAQPSFESELISLGYLWSFTAKSGSLTGNELKCNARIVVAPETSEKSEKSEKSRECRPTDAPPPYFPKDINLTFY